MALKWNSEAPSANENSPFHQHAKDPVFSQTEMRLILKRVAKNQNSKQSKLCSPAKQSCFLNRTRGAHISKKGTASGTQRALKEIDTSAGGKI
jgi:hypothetical protein